MSKLKEFTKDMKALKKMWDDSEELAIRFELDIESTMQNHLWSLFDIIVKVMAKAYDDKGEWLNWYIYDNNWGKDGLECEVNNKPVQIRTATQLYKAITSK